MPAKKQTVVCPSCKQRVAVAGAKWNSQYKDYTYFSDPHRHSDDNFYLVRIASTGKIQVSAWREPQPKTAATKVLAAATPGRFGRAAKRLGRVFGR